MAAVRLSELPPAFLQHAPREAAFALALLNRDAAKRPSLANLLASDNFSHTTDGLRQRHCTQEVGGKGGAKFSRAERPGTEGIQVLGMVEQGVRREWDQGIKAGGIEGWGVQG